MIPWLDKGSAGQFSFWICHEVCGEYCDISISFHFRNEEYITSAVGSVPDRQPSAISLLQGMPLWVKASHPSQGGLYPMTDYYGDIKPNPFIPIWYRYKGSSHLRTPQKGHLRLLIKLFSSFISPFFNPASNPFLPSHRYLNPKHFLMNGFCLRICFLGNLTYYMVALSWWPRLEYSNRSTGLNIYNGSLT